MKTNIEIVHSQSSLFNCKFNRVVFILPSLAVGGAEYNAVRMANHLVKQGMDVEAWGILKDTSIAQKFDTRIKVTSFGARRLLGGFFKIWKRSRGSEKTLFISNLWPVNLISYFSLIFLNRSNKALFVEHIDLKMGLDKSKKIEQYAAQAFHRWARIVNLRFVAVSNGVANGLISDFGLTSNQVRRIYNPILTDADLIKSNNLDSRISSPLRILAVGHLKPQKDYLTLIRALSEIKCMGIPFEAKIAGEGPERASIESLITSLKLGECVNLLGFISEPMELYRWADVFVITSKWEGLGNVIVEALSAKCHVIATDCPSGPREILASGDFGRLVRVSDEKGIAEAIIESVDDVLDESRLQTHLKQFNIKEVTMEYISFACEA